MHLLSISRLPQDSRALTPARLASLTTPTRPAPAASPLGLSPDAMRWQESGRWSLSRTGRNEHGQRRPQAACRVVQHEEKGVVGAEGGVPAGQGRVGERIPCLHECGRGRALAHWEDRARATTPTSRRSGHATQGERSSRRRRRRTYGSG
jgi:hypothetical protein